MVAGAPVTVPLTELLVAETFVPMLQLFGRQEAEIATAPGATPLTFAPVLVPAAAATEDCVEVQVKLGKVVTGAPVLSVTVTVSARLAPVAIVKCVVSSGATGLLTETVIVFTRHCVNTAGALVTGVTFPIEAVMLVCPGCTAVAVAWSVWPVSPVAGMVATEEVWLVQLKVPTDGVISVPPLNACALNTCVPASATHAGAVGVIVTLVIGRWMLITTVGLVTPPADAVTLEVITVVAVTPATGVHTTGVVRLSHVPAQSNPFCVI